MWARWRSPCRETEPARFARGCSSDLAAWSRRWRMRCFAPMWSVVSTSRVGDIAQALSGWRISASSIGRLNGRLSERLQAWRERPLSGTHPYLYPDGISLTVRWAGASERMRVLAAIGVRHEDLREVLACTAGFRESEESWPGLLRGLSERGLQGVRLVISDACARLEAAVEDFLPRAGWQRCKVHVIRNVLDKVPQSRRADVAAALKTIWY